MILQMQEDDVEKVKCGQARVVVWAVLQSLGQSSISCFQSVQDFPGELVSI